MMTDTLVDAHERPIASRPRWQIDRSIPVSLIMSLFLQSVVIIIWAVHLDSRVGVLEHTSVSNENYARLDEKMTSVKEALGDLKNEMTDLNRKVGGRR